MKILSRGTAMLDQALAYIGQQFAERVKKVDHLFLATTPPIFRLCKCCILRGPSAI
jgi:hypothetical protein